MSQARRREDIGSQSVTITLDVKLNSLASRRIALLVIELWLAVSIVIDLGASIIMTKTEWGPGLPPADYIENLGTYQLGYFFSFSSITYMLAALLSGVSILIVWLLKKKIGRPLLYLVIMNLVLCPTSWMLAHLVFSRLE